MMQAHIEALPRPQPEFKTTYGGKLKEPKKYPNAEYRYEPLNRIPMRLWLMT